MPLLRLATAKLATALAEAAAPAGRPPSSGPGVAGASFRWPLVGRDEELMLLDAVARHRPGRRGRRRRRGQVPPGRHVAGDRRRADHRRRRHPGQRHHPLRRLRPLGPDGPRGRRRPAGHAPGRRRRPHRHRGHRGRRRRPPARRGSAALVLHLVRHTPVGVVATLRSGEPCPDPITALWVQEDGTRIDLRPLSEEECADPDGPASRRPASTPRPDAACGPSRPATRCTSGRRPRRRWSRAASWPRTGRGPGRGAWPGPPRLVDLVEARLGRLDADDRRGPRAGRPGRAAADRGPRGPGPRVPGRDPGGRRAVGPAGHRGGRAAWVWATPSTARCCGPPPAGSRARQHHHDLAVAATGHGLDRRDPLRIAGGGSTPRRRAATPPCWWRPRPGPWCSRTTRCRRAWPRRGPPPAEASRRSSPCRGPGG